MGVVHLYQAVPEQSVMTVIGADDQSLKMDDPQVAERLSALLIMKRFENDFYRRVHAEEHCVV